jgi:hypothetical protein
MRRARCRCGVWIDCHRPGRFNCGNPRPASTLRLWFRDHDTRRHITGWLWIKVPEKYRWRVAGWYHDRRPGLCWCEMVNAVLQSYEKGDDLCGVALLTDATPSKYGQCYCMPPPEWVES